MAKRQSVYTPEFRRQMVELVRVGRSPEELPVSSSRPRNQSAIGWHNRIVMRAAVMAGCERRSVRNSTG
jgi:hypothetical protein